MTSVLQAAAQIARRLGFPGLPDHAKRGVQTVKSTFDPLRYRTPAGPARVLKAEHVAPTEIGAGRAQAPAGGIYDHWCAIPGGHKWLHYFGIYDGLMGPLRQRPIRMLEIGVYRGASLKMWRSYLSPESVLVGIDIDPTCAGFERADQKVFVRIGSQADQAFLQKVVDEFGPFDVILDDGSHVNSHMIASFKHLFMQGLVDDGLYIAEDTHTNFWPTYRDQAYSFIDLSKDLVDVMHAHYTGAGVGEGSFRAGQPNHAQTMTVPLIAAHIREIGFHDSIISIRKKPATGLPVSQHN